MLWLLVAVFVALWVAGLVARVGGTGVHLLLGGAALALCIELFGRRSVD